MKEQEILQRIAEEDEFVVGALFAIYKYQTPYEQNIQATLEQNNMGFNAVDAGILSDMAKYYERERHLSDKQINFIRRTITKYIGQLKQTEIKTMSVSSKQIQRIEVFKKANINQEGSIIASFSFPKGDPGFRETLEKIKSLPERKYNPDGKCWILPKTVPNIEQLKEWGFEIKEKLQAWYDEEIRPPTQIQLPEGLKLYPFQEEGVAFLEKWKGNALIGSEMGLGKTIQALTWLRIHPELRPALIVVPATLKLNWRREAKKWIPDEKVQIISGGKETDIIGDIVIINYDILSKHLETLLKIESKVMVIDESTAIKNQKAQRTVAAKKLGRKIKHIIALSGTPIINRPVEFFNVLNLLRPDLYKSFWRFTGRYCSRKHTGFGWDFSGATNTEELHSNLVKTCMIRHLKKDVLPDLPDKTRSIIPLELTNRNEYDRAEKDLIAWIAENEGKAKAEKAKQAEALVSIEKLKSLSLQGKKKAIKEWIEDFIGGNGKLVVFCTHHETIDWLMGEFKNAVKLDGRDSAEQKQAAVDQFQNDEKIRLFVGNIKAAGMGITLTAASSVAFVELGWTPGEHSQAEDRTHRIGQKNAVNCYYLVAEDTIETEILTLLDSKQKVLDMVLDGKETEDVHLLTELLNKLKNS